MSNPIDQASEVEQRDRDLAISVARQKAQKAMLPPIGICYNCHEPVAEGSRYCPGPDCRDDHQARKQADIRRGGDVLRISDGIKARGFPHNLAVALVKAWQADARMTRVSEDLIAELCEKLPGASFFVYKMSARAFLGTHSKQANEYLWANKFNSAKLWLMKHGAEKNGSKYLAEVRRLGKQANAHRLAAISENNKFFGAHRLSEQWGVCK